MDLGGGDEMTTVDTYVDGKLVSRETVKATRTPEIPPPCWDERPITGEDAMAAVRALSKGAA
jgi:hypothetical protein